MAILFRRGASLPEYDIKSASVEVEACEQGRANRPCLHFLEMK